MNAIHTDETQPRLICLLSPEGCTETEVIRHWGSQSIIGYQQYQLIRRHSGIRDVCLYENGKSYRDDDVLLIMMCLPGVLEDTLSKFKRIIYYFDDMGAYKAKQIEYASRLSRVDAYISPVASLANEMNERGLKQSFYVPWSMNDVEFPIIKTEKPSIFVDMDDRHFTADSIERGYDLARLCIGLNFDVYTFEKYSHHCPDDLRTRLGFVPRTGHPPFMKLLASMWFYASGIRGSYEYSVLESAMLGCGLISIDSAVKTEHIGRSCFLLFNNQPDFAHQLKSAIEHFDTSAIMDDARKLYPQNGSSTLREIIERCYGDLPA